MAVDDVSFSVRPNAITGLIGPNGAGKTTVFNLITGFIRPDEGRVYLQGREVTGYAPHRLVGEGIVRSWQGLRLFYQMTVLDNVVLALPRATGEESPWGPLIMLGRTAARKQEKRERALEYLNFVGLADKADELTAGLAFAEQRLLSLAVVMATEAKILLLDEPASGLDIHAATKVLVPLIGKLARDHNKTILLVEHVLDVVRGLCDHIFYLGNGRVLAEGTCESLMNNKDLARDYFGLGTRVRC